MKTPIQKLENVWLNAWQRELGPDATLTDEEQAELHKFRQEASEQEEAMNYDEGDTSIIIDGEECPIEPKVSRLIRWISKERDELKQKLDDLSS